MPEPLRLPHFTTWLDWHIRTLSFYVRRKWVGHERYAEQLQMLKTVRDLHNQRQQSPDARVRVWQWWVYWSGMAYYLWANDWDNPEARAYRRFLHQERDRRLAHIQEENKFRK